MGKIFDIGDDVRQTMADAIDDVLDQLGKDCQLIFPGTPTYCPNCIFDPQNKRSSNIPKPGAAKPFAAGQTCPVCMGSGFLPGTSEKTEDIKLLVSWNPKQWDVQLPPGIETPQGVVQTKGYLTDAPRVLQSRQLILEMPIEPIRRYRFKLLTEPIDAGNIVQGRYMTCLWQRAGG